MKRFFVAHCSLESSNEEVLVRMNRNAAAVKRGCC